MTDEDSRDTLDEETLPSSLVDKLLHISDRQSRAAQRMADHTEAIREDVRQSSEETRATREDSRNTRDAVFKHFRKVSEDLEVALGAHRLEVMGRLETLQTSCETRMPEGNALVAAFKSLAMTFDAYPKGAWSAVALLALLFTYLVWFGVGSPEAVQLIISLLSRGELPSPN